MATATHQTARTTTRDRAAASPNALMARLNAWRSKRREIARIEFELRTYTERNLADLGLTAYDIPAVARGQYRR